MNCAHTACAIEEVNSFILITLFFRAKLACTPKGGKPAVGLNTRFSELFPSEINRKILFQSDVFTLA